MRFTRARASTKFFFLMTRTSLPSTVSHGIGREYRRPMDSLDDLIATWLDEEMQESPVRATALGIDGHDGELGHFAAADFERKADRDTDWLNRLNALDRAPLTKDEEIDLDLLRSSLRGRQISETWQGWRRDPATYLGPCLSGVFQLFLSPTHPEPELAAFATSRLRQVPEVLDH